MNKKEKFALIESVLNEIELLELKSTPELRAAVRKRQLKASEYYMGKGGNAMKPKRIAGVIGFMGKNKLARNAGSSNNPIPLYRGQYRKYAERKMRNKKLAIAGAGGATLLAGAAAYRHHKKNTNAARNNQ